MGIIKPPIEVICAICHKPFLAKPYNTPKCCSSACTHELRSQITHRRVGYAKQVTLTCPDCGNDFSLSASQKNQRRCPECISKAKLAWQPIQTETQVEAIEQPIESSCWRKDPINHKRTDSILIKHPLAPLSQYRKRNAQKSVYDLWASGYNFGQIAKIYKVYRYQVSDEYYHEVDNLTQMAQSMHNDLLQRIDVVSALPPQERKARNPTPHSLAKEKMKSEAIRLHAEGLSSYKIADMLGKPAKTVQGWLKKEQRPNDRAIGNMWAW
jgi:hypothetical protein